MWRTVGLLILLLLGGTGKAHGRQEADPEQIDRRDRRQPELILETGGRTGSCDALQFTRDGRFLLAAGDDKVVRVWRVKDGKLEKADPHVLRWARWREQRGSIYAMDIDAEGKRVAVAGLGMRPRLTVAVLDRETGGVITWLDGLHKESMDVSTIRALVFSPSGKKLALGMSDGRVWEWGLKGEPWLVGRHAPLPGAPKDLNRIRLLHYFTDDDLLSVAESGEVGRWDVKATPARRVLKISHPPSVREAAVTPDGERLVICAYGKTPQVAFLPLTGTGKTDGIGLKLTEQRCCVALSPDGKAMLVGVGANPVGKELEGDDRLRLYDGASPKPVWESAPGYRIDKVTFSPCGKFFAVAGGPNYEVSLWKRSDLSRPSGVAGGEGAGLWEVAFSEGSDTLVGFRDRRASPRALRNRQGAGPWRAFDLRGRAFTPGGAGFKPQRGQESADGWSLEPNGADHTVWDVSNGRARHRLKYDRDREGAPRSYTFLPKGGGAPTRLIIGHDYGLISVFELSDKEARRVRVFVGHSAEVTSLAVAPNREWFLSASSDQTLSAWSLKPFENQRELGAAFEARGKRIYVKGSPVALFSPAWEADLQHGDEVVCAGSPNKLQWFFDPAGKKGEVRADTGRAMELLSDPEPAVELSLVLRRAGAKKLLERMTTVKQRPLWRFFPARNNEWVLWTWHQPYYDCSDGGDSLIGWHSNHPKRIYDKPAFRKAEELRGIFHHQGVIDQLIKTRDVKAALDEVRSAKDPFDFTKFEAVAPRIGPIKAGRAKSGAVEVTVAAEPESLAASNPDQMPQRAELWVNDHRVGKWYPRGSPMRETVTIPDDRLRSGKNLLTFQIYNHVTGWGEGRAEHSVPLERGRREGKPALHGLVVGASDYSRSDDFKATDGHRLPGVEQDASRLYEALGSAKGDLYQSVRLERLPDPKSREGVTKGNILRRLAAVAGRVAADDVFVLLLAGHGHVVNDKKGELFVFCCPEFSTKTYQQTSVTAMELLDALAEIRCRKVVLIDACHAGQLRFSPIRGLTPGKKGPTILVSCERNQRAYEKKDGSGGLFSTAIHEAMGARFAAADVAPRDGVLDEEELFNYVKGRLRDLLAEVGEPAGRQVPSRFSLDQERRPLFGRPAAEPRKGTP